MTTFLLAILLCIGVDLCWLLCLHRWVQLRTLLNNLSAALIQQKKPVCSNTSMTEKGSETANEPKVSKPEPAKGSTGTDPGGIRSIRTTAAFRAVNFELYAKPVIRSQFSFFLLFYHDLSFVKIALIFFVSEQICDGIWFVSDNWMCCIYCLYACSKRQ